MTDAELRELIISHNNARVAMHSDDIINDLLALRAAVRRERDVINESTLTPLTADEWAKSYKAARADLARLIAGEKD